MCFQSIYKRLKNDFSFIYEYGYVFERNLKHYVYPSVSFVKDDYSFEIGFSFENKKFFVLFFDKKIRQYPSGWYVSQNERFKEGWVKPKVIVSEKTELPGKKYKDQVEVVKDLVKNFLEPHK